MKIHLASRFEDRFRMREVRSELMSIGHVVTSQWLEHGMEVTSLDPLKDLHEEASKDLRNVNEANIFVLFNDHKGGKGRWVELGFALALNKHIIVIGPKNCVFLHLGIVLNFDSWGEAFIYIRDALD